MAPLAGFDVSFARTQPLGQDSPPVLHTLTPANTQPVRVAKGDTLVFTATFIDPEADTLKYVWYLNNFPVSFGRSYTFLSYFYAEGEHHVRVAVSDGANLVDASWQVIIGTTAVKTPGVSQPTAFKLEQSFPNPIRRGVETGKIVFHVPRLSRVSLTVYDVLGRAVRRLLDTEKAPGIYEAVWNGREEGGRLLPSGVYWLKMQADGFQAIKRMALVQ